MKKGTTDKHRLTQIRGKGAEGKKEYRRPEVVWEGELETRAGSPIPCPPSIDPLDPDRCQ